ncbi:hypothetical protein H0H93_006997 [Arthromyces matolae]|nr:hypothetical protein H0H93_006997 [Arthromyces matolae]
MTLYATDYQALWKDGRFFAQLSAPSANTEKTPSDGTLVGEVSAVATDLLGRAYQLGSIPCPFEPAKGFEVYEALTAILPTLSGQSAFFWDRGARPLASQLATAKYPIRSQARHLIFWWARIGGLVGVTSLQARCGAQAISATSDGSNLEFSWAIPRNTDPSEESNRMVRFSVDPYHPELGHRMAGGPVIDYLCSPEGNMGLVNVESGCTKWKDILEKWLFPDIKSTEEFVEGTTYGVAFEMEPSGAINLKVYYIPPLLPRPGITPRSRATCYRRMEDLKAMRNLAKQLDPSLEAPMEIFVDYLETLSNDAKMKLTMFACDVSRPETNRLKVYLLSRQTKFKDIVHDLTLGGQISGPKIDNAMANFSTFFKHFFPYKENGDVYLKVRDSKQPNLDGKDIFMMYYYEFFVGEPVPYPKVRSLLLHDTSEQQ